MKMIIISIFCIYMDYAMFGQKMYLDSNIVQNKIVAASDLLGDNGSLLQTGWSEKYIVNYNKEEARGRLKEWDNYNFFTRDFSLSVTYADVGYIGLLSLKWRDFKTNEIEYGKKVIFFPGNKMNLPVSPLKGDINFQNKDVRFSVKHVINGRKMHLNFPGFSADTLACNLLINNSVKTGRVTVVHPWSKGSKYFTLSEKEIPLSVIGSIKKGKSTYTLYQDSCWAILDWGRSVRPRKGNWQWAFGTYQKEGNTISWNLGAKGSAEGTPYNQNVVFYNGVAHKIGDVEIMFDEHNIMLPWEVTEMDGRLHLIFTPFMKEIYDKNMIWLKTNIKQVYGYYSGYAILDNGEKIYISHALGMMEDVLNKW